MVGNNDGVESPWPRLWDGVYDISIFIETPMHLIFHGVLADVVEVIDEFLAEHKLQKGFHDRVNGILLDVIALRLEWCKMKTLPKKQWLAENELGYACLMTFLYAQFFLGL